MSDAEAAAANYMMLTVGWEPEKFCNRSRKSRAFIMAGVQIKIDAEKKEMAKAKSGKKR